jgi:uncharacterized protein YbjQ (UPF0145 family)
MIVTTTSTIPNEEIKGIISVVHNRVVLGTNLFSDISASFSDFFGGNNSAYEKRLAEITDDVIVGLKKKALKLRANALIDLRIDVDEINGKNKSMFMVTAIATAVSLNKDFNKNIDFENSGSFSFEEINSSIIKNRILKISESEGLNPNLDWILDYITNNEFPEIFEDYINYIQGISKLKYPPTVPEFWATYFEQFINNLKSEDLFEKTFKYFSKETRNETENKILAIILNRLNIDYAKILTIFNGNDLEQKRLCLNMLYHPNEFYKNSDFENIKKILEQINVTFPNTSIIEEGAGLFSKGVQQWVCICGSKNDLPFTKYCARCNNDQFGNKNYVRNVNEVIEKLEEILNAVKI